MLSIRLTHDERDLILKLGQGWLFRKKLPNGIDESVELFKPGEPTEKISWEMYHQIRNKGLGERVKSPVVIQVDLFTAITDGWLYYGLNEEGKKIFNELIEGKK